jgi:hypothetical protein
MNGRIFSIKNIMCDCICIELRNFPFFLFQFSFCFYVNTKRRDFREWEQSMNIHPFILRDISSTQNVLLLSFSYFTFFFIIHRVSLHLPGMSVRMKMKVISREWKWEYQEWREWREWKKLRIAIKSKEMDHI